jgi:hypothetical protein
MLCFVELPVEIHYDRQQNTEKYIAFGGSIILEFSLFTEVLERNSRGKE